MSGYDEAADYAAFMALPTWERVPCAYCGMHHAPGTACLDPVDGTRWDQ